MTNPQEPVPPTWNGPVAPTAWMMFGDGVQPKVRLFSMMSLPVIVPSMIWTRPETEFAASFEFVTALSAIFPVETALSAIFPLVTALFAIWPVVTALGAILPVVTALFAIWPVVTALLASWPVV